MLHIISGAIVMRIAAILLGVVLIGLGVWIAFGDAHYTNTSATAQFGPVQVEATTQKSVPVRVGYAGIVFGGVLVIAGILATATARKSDAIEEKNLPLAIGLNILLPGLGYMYMGKWVVGFLACLLVLGLYAATGLLYVVPTWIGLNAIMAIDMFILDGKNKKRIAEATMMKCPNCAETIKREAKICRYCNTKLSAS